MIETYISSLVCILSKVLIVGLLATSVDCIASQISPGRKAKDIFGIKTTVLNRIHQHNLDCA